MKDPPSISFVLEVLRKLESLERKLANLPKEAEPERARLRASIEELRAIIRKLVS